MTTYAKITDFASKDALLTGNPAKIVKGVEIDDEFNAIATADATSVKGPIVVTVDNTVVRWDGTTGRAVQGSGVTISDADVVTASGFTGPHNGTVGATTPSTGAFTTLSATGNTTLGDASTDTVQVNGYMGVGGAAATNTGLFARNAALTGVNQYGVGAYPISTSAATTKIVGFGSGQTTAAATFTVVDSIGFEAATTTKGAGSTITNQHGVLVADQTQGTNNYGITSLVSSGANKWNIYASGTAANYFAGNVGIGGTSSGGKLEIINAGTVNWLLNNTTGAVQTAAYASSTKGSVGTVTNHSLTLFTNNTDRVTIDSAGNLGLGVTPSAWGAGRKALELGGVSQLVSSGTTLEIGTNWYNNGTNYIYKATNVASLYSPSNGLHVWYTAPSGTAGNAITFTQAMTLDASGNLLVGIASNLAADCKLEVKNTTTATPTAYIWNATTTGDAIFAAFGTEAAVTQRGSIDYNRAGGLVRYNTTSDGELKNIIGDAPQQKSLDVLADTRLREYSWKDDATNKAQIGVIAQEVHQVFPGAVSVGGEYTEEVPAVLDDEGNEVTPATTVTKYRPWAVDKTAWTFHLIAGYQHLKAENDALKATLDTALARLTALENANA